MDSVMDEKLQKALASLPVAFRKAVWLCDVEDRSYEEIAEIMSCSIGTVRSRIHRGRALLRKAMEVIRTPLARPKTLSSAPGTEQGRGELNWAV